MSHQLSDAIGEYLASMAGAGDKPATVKNKRQTLTHLLTVVGNIQTRNVSGAHIDVFFTAMNAKQHAPGTLNGHLFNLRHFFRWSWQRGYRPRGDDPTVGRRPAKVPERLRLRVPASDFGRLLDCAPHPRDRIVVALGLYLFLRQGEIGLLRIGSLDLDRGEIQVTIPKTAQVDTMPICTELDVELRRWLTYYARTQPTPLQASWYLAPAKSRPKWVGVGQSRFARIESGAYEVANPDVRMQKIADAVKRTLVNAGYPVADDTGKSNMEGVHTLRRSGARALFDELLGRGYDGALRQVQSMLHHKNSTMTEHYLGIDIDAKRRNEALRGRSMFAKVETGTVVRLVASSEG